MDNAQAVADGAWAAEEQSEAVETPKRGGLKVRLSEERDIPKAKQILRQHLTTTEFRDEPFSEWKVNEHIARALSRPPRMLSATAEWQGECVGLAWALADSFMLTDGPLFVTVHLIAVDLDLPPLRRAKTFLALVAAIRKWAGSLKASKIYVHVTTGSNIKGTDRLMKAAGAKFVGGAYVVQAQNLILHKVER